MTNSEIRSELFRRAEVMLDDPHEAATREYYSEWEGLDLPEGVGYSEACSAACEQIVRDREAAEIAADRARLIDEGLYTAGVRDAFLEVVRGVQDDTRSWTDAQFLRDVTSVPSVDIRPIDFARPRNERVARAAEEDEAYRRRIPAVAFVQGQCLHSTEATRAAGAV